MHIKVHRVPKRKRQRKGKKQKPSKYNYIKIFLEGWYCIFSRYNTSVLIHKDDVDVIEHGRKK